MENNRNRRVKSIFIFSMLLVMLLTLAPGFAMAEAEDEGLPPDTRFFIPRPNRGAIEQIIDLWHDRNWEDAFLIKKMIWTPQAVWFTAGTPRSVQRDVRRTVRMAAFSHSVPVLVAYNIPFRDCAQFSAGGATTVEEYKAWIDGFARGIGHREAVVILEPDGLGIIPWYKPFRGTDSEAADYEWCQPSEADEATAADERFEMLNYAVDALKAKPNVSVYLDGTHSAWLNVSDISHRLLQAGVENADGFYLNASNYQYTANLVQYGTWVSSCVSMWDPADLSGYVDCPNQYWNGGPDGTKIADLLGPWTGVALSSYGEWSDDSDVPELNTSGVNARYEGTEPTTRFVIDTSRNGQGPWEPGDYPDAQDWCNPPDRGLGLRPTADTDNPLVDAYLWIKIPGESDGECTRGLGDAGETVDPEWGLIDPAAGEWFPEMALQLAENANPPLWP
jgi:endoglucanase